MTARGRAEGAAGSNDTPWWKSSVVYQIYPRSFNDTTGNGIGDLRGITQKLDYLEDLGVDVVWLCPVYDSPNDDNGYDIRDYRKIAAEFGTMDDWERMLAAMHARGIRLIMDLVVNHTSDEHAWFRASRSSRDDPKRDFYIWRPPGPDGGPPNRWASFFGGSAWELDETTGEYYLHLFSRKQPDLNWENPSVREAIYEMIGWWLDKGIDGFRLDAINLISKPRGLPDAPHASGDRFEVPVHAFNGPRLMEFLRELKKRAFAGRDVLTVGETPQLSPEQGLELTHAETGALGMVHQFEHLEIDKDEASDAPRWVGKRFSLVELKRVLSRWQIELEDHGWNGNFLSNHDLPRPVSRFGDDGAYWRASATMLATLVHMLKGTPFIYQGDEIGMTNVGFGSIDDYRDVETTRMFREFVQERGLDEDDVMEMIHAKSRDNARTPMQWDASEHAGFTQGTPWIGVNPNYRQINVASQAGDPDSILSYHQDLIRLRRTHPVVVHGSYVLIAPADEAVFAFTRTWNEERLIVVLNFTDHATRFVLEEHLLAEGPRLLLANYARRPDEVAEGMQLAPYEARVYLSTPARV